MHGASALKTLAFIVRRSDVSREDFREHYERIHAPLALPLLDGLRRYVRHHVREPLSAGVDFDCMTSFWWADASALPALLAKLDAEPGAVIREDEQSFMNPSANAFFPATEVDLPGPSASTGNLWLGVSFEDSTHTEAGIARYERRQLPALSSELRAPIAVHNRAIPVGGRARFDCVSVLRTPDAPADRGLRDWVAELAAAGCRVTAARVSEHESSIP